MNILAIDPGMKGGIAIWGWKDGERTLQGQAMLYFGEDDACAFQEHFDEIGVVLT